MIINKGIATGFMALCMAIILTGCPMPGDDNRSEPSVDEPVDSDDPAVDEKTVDPDAPPAAPVVPDRITGDPDDVADFLNNDAVSGKSSNIKITADAMTLVDDVIITGNIFFTADKRVTVTVKNLVFSAGSSLHLDPNVTLLLDPAAGANPNVRHSVNYTGNSAGNPQGKIVINKDAALKAASDALIWNSAAQVEIFNGGTVNSNNMTITPASHVVFNSANFPLPFTFTAPGSGYDAYKVTSYIAAYPAGCLALMQKAAGLTRTGNIAEWVPSNFDNNEKYVYITNSGFLDTLAKIAGKPLILVIGSDSAKKEWYENGATHVILTGELGSSGSVTVNVTDFPVVLPQGKLSGGSNAKITVTSGVYLDVASTQTGTGTFGGGLYVQSGGAVRNSSLTGWALGQGSVFYIDYGSRIAVGDYSVSNGWLIGKNADDPRMLWQYNNEYDLGGSVAITRDDMILTGALRVQKNTGITYNVNIAQGSVLTLAAVLDLLGADRGIYAVPETKGGSMGSSSYNANYSRPAGKLVLGGGKISRMGAALQGLDTAGEYTYNGVSKSTNTVTIGSSQRVFYSLEQ